MFIETKLMSTIMISNYYHFAFQCVCTESHHYMKLEKNKGVRGKVLEHQPWMEAKSWIKSQHSWDLFPLSLSHPSLSPPTLLYPFPSNKSTQGEKNKMAMQDLVAPQIFLCVGQENWTKAFLLQRGRKCTRTNISTHISKGKIDQDSTIIKANCAINGGLIVKKM